VKVVKSDSGTVEAYQVSSLPFSRVRARTDEKEIDHSGLRHLKHGKKSAKSQMLSVLLANSSSKEESMITSSTSISEEDHRCSNSLTTSTRILSPLLNDSSLRTNFRSATSIKSQTSLRRTLEGFKSVRAEGSTLTPVLVAIDQGEVGQVVEEGEREVRKVSLAIRTLVSPLSVFLFAVLAEIVSLIVGGGRSAPPPSSKPVRSSGGILPHVSLLLFFVPL